MSRLVGALASLALVLTACAGGGATSKASAAPPLVIGGIPDQDVSLLQDRFDGLARYLSKEVGIPVRYQPAVDYAAVVTAFSNGEVKLGWFGGLTGVQARIETNGARAVAQRPIDATFRSVFIAGPGLTATDVAGLKGSRFTFGSESSTSGHLMPRYFMQQAGIDPDERLSRVPWNFGGGP